MNWRDLISSPPPDTVWHVDEAMVAVISRDRKGEDRCAAGDLQRGVFEAGSAGIRSVDSDRLAAVLGRLHGEVGGSKRAAVVMPTAWVRAFVVDLDEVPRRQRDLDEVLRWRLKKILSVPAIDLRLASAVQPPYDGRQHVLCAVALEKAMAHLEQAFAASGVTPGLIVPRILALSMEPADTASLRLYVQHEPSLLSMLLIAEGGIRLIRTKLLPSGVQAVGGIEREITLAITYMRDQLGLDKQISATVSALDDDAVSRLSSCLEDQSQVEVHSAAVGRLCGDPGFLDRIGRFRCAPMAAVLRGGRP